MTLRKRHYICEYLLSLVLLTQCACFHLTLSLQILSESMLAIIFCIAFIALILRKHSSEGQRFNTIIAIITEIQIILNIFLHSSIIGITSIIFTILYIGSIIFFVSYHFPDPTGPYKVGFKTFQIKNLSRISVFYPTLEETYDSPWQDTANYWEKLYEFSLLKGSIMKKIFGLTSTFISKLKLGVHTDAEIIVNKNIQYPITLFIHGLGAHINAYSILLKELASKGHVIFSIGVEDQIFLNPESREIRRLGLLKRCKIVKSFIDILHSEQNLFENMFPEIRTSNASLKLDNLNIMGHSFGGATALYTACHDQRITGHTVLLDPWVYPLPDDLNLIKMKKPFMCIMAENFDIKFPIFKNDKIWKNLLSISTSENIVKQSFKCIIKKSGHNNSSDMAFMMPGELIITGFLQSTKDCYEQMDIIRNLVYKFITEYDYENFHNKTILPTKYHHMLELFKY